MFCKKCGQELESGDRFCPQCGFPVEKKTEVTKADSAHTHTHASVKNDIDDINETGNSVGEFDWEDDLYEVPKAEQDQSTKRQRDTIKWIISIAVSTVFLFITAAIVSNMLRRGLEDDYPRIVVNSQKSSASGQTSNKGQGTEKKTDDIIVPTRPPMQTPTPKPSPVPTVVPTAAVKPDQSEIKVVKEEYEVFGGEQESGTKNTHTGEGDYVFPQSAVGYLSRAQLEGLTKDQLLYARNEIYARHGRKFLDQTIQSYFNGKSWYSPSYEAAEFDAVSESVFNEYEKANIKLISDYETEKGYFY
ncbi:YARHG domain-containing protein [Blautia schinkii]|nr:YARHG domain-containing protein [Blautia schinkii]